MADRKSNYTNAFETTLTATLDGLGTLAVCADVSGLVAPGYLCIDPDDPAKREYVRFSVVSSPNLTLSERYLTGSAQGAGITHDSGAVVRMVPLAQAFEDIHDRIDAVDASIISDHGALSGLGDDDHPQYLQDAEHTKAVHDALLINADTLDTYHAADFSLATHDHDTDYLGITATAAAATKLATARSIILTGDVTGSALFDGTGNASISAVVANDSHTHGTQYLGLTATAAAATKLATARSIGLGGDASGSAMFDGAGNITITTTVANDSHTHDTRYYTEAQADGRYIPYATPRNIVSNSFADFKLRNVWIGSSTPSATYRETGDLWFQT